MKSLGLGANAAIFVIAAVAIWIAGTRLERTVDVVARRTGLGQAFSGMLLLAAATSLPEVATTITAVAVLHDPTLAVHNLLGGVAMQTAIIGIADAAKGRRGALTFFTPRFVLLVQGVGLLLHLQVTVGGIAAKGFPSVGPVSIWAIFLAASYFVLMYLVYRDRGNQRWTPDRADDVPEEAREEQDESDDVEEDDPRSTRRIWLTFAGLSVAVLGGGYVATQTAEVLAKQTGLGSAFMGATLLAVATSLPEISTTTSAVRNKRYTAAISNVFGSNAFDVVLLVLAEALYTQGTIFAHAESTVIFVASVGTAMTCIYLWGLMERENRTVLGIGVDSFAALTIYLGGMVVLYFVQ
jgi:cation:H+ antiporter